MCGACNVSISQALKPKNKCETYQFRWLKNKGVCCVPSCGSTDIEVNVHRHDFSWEDVCNSIGIASVLPQLTVYYVRSITNKYIECSMWYRKHVYAVGLNGDMSIVPHYL